MAPAFPTEVDASFEALPASSPARQAYPEDLYPNGSYHPSPFGRTRYWIVGPENGQKVVLIHGISWPAPVWKNIVDVLLSKGFRVLLYDLYGRGYSESPRLPQDPNLYALQLATLLQYIRWDSAYIVGFSMGGAIASAFTALFPHLVESKVVFVAAAGMMEGPNLNPAPKTNTDAGNRAGEQAAKFRTLQLENLPNFKRVLEGSRDDGPITGVRWAYEQVGKANDKQVLIIHGTADNIVPYNEANKITALIPGAKLVPLEGGSHYLPAEEGMWEELAKALVTFLADGKAAL